jgi:hypothetical protein
VGAGAGGGGGAGAGAGGGGGSPAGGGGGLPPPPPPLRARPSEVEAALREASGGRPLAHAHALRRAAAWLAMREEGLVEEPATDAAARRLLREREAARLGGGNWGGEAAAEAEEARAVGTLAPLWGALGAAWEAVAEGAGPAAARAAAAEAALAPAAVQAAAAGGPAPAPRHWDAPLPLLHVLSLYGSAAGGRGEGVPPPPPSAEGAPSAMLSPSERLGVWVAMCREVRRAAARGAGGGGAGAALPALPAAALSAAPAAAVAAAAAAEAEAVVAQAREASGSGSSGSGSGGGSSSAPAGLSPAYTLAELEEVLALLGATFQQPTRARTGIVETLPDFRYALAPPRDSVDTALREAQIDLKKSPALPRAVGAPEETSFWGVPKPVPGVLEPLPAERAWLTADEARRVLLQSRAVCLWGECNRNKAEYKGALFS